MSWVILVLIGVSKGNVGDDGGAVLEGLKNVPFLRYVLPKVKFMAPTL